MDIYIPHTQLALSYPHVVYSALGIICRNLSNPRLFSALLICMNYVSVMGVCYGGTAYSKRSWGGTSTHPLYIIF